MKPKINSLTNLSAAVAGLLLTAGASQAASTIIFADDFSGTNLNEAANTNASLSGTAVAGLGTSTPYNLYLGGSATEGSGLLTVTPGTQSVGGRSPLIQSKVNLVPHIIPGGSLTISLVGLNPVVGGGGADGDWAAWMLTNTVGDPVSGNDTPNLNGSSVQFAALYRDTGLMNVASPGTLGALINSNINFDGGVSGTGTGGSYDIDIVMDSITATSMNVAMFLDGSASSFYSTTVTGIDLSSIYFSFEARTDASTLDGLVISTIPEPSAALLGGLGLLALLRRRRA